jgi:hypothetical protein
MPNQLTIFAQPTRPLRTKLDGKFQLLGCCASTCVLYRYWSCYDQLTNSFAVEGLRALTAAATRQGLVADAARWDAIRTKILNGINAALTTEPPHAAVFSSAGNPNAGASASTVYAELRGHPNDFKEDKADVGYSPLLWGTSYENIAPAVIALTVIGDGSGGSGPSDDGARDGSRAKALGLDEARLERTWGEYRRAGAFQWLNPTPELSAFVLTTHVNSSGWIDPPTNPGTPPPSPPVTACSPQKWFVTEAPCTKPDVNALDTYTLGIQSFLSLGL